jgi:uncharacterized protein (TIGR03663 family)
MSATVDPQQAPTVTVAPTAEAAAARRAGLAGFSISLETVVWLAVIAVAAALRLARLEHLPLTIDESVRALGSWQTSEGNVPGNWSGDLTQAATAYLFAALGAGDQLARLAPALFGCLAVALCWPLARENRGAALIGAALLAISPLLVHVSRSGLPYAAGAVLSLAMVAAFFAFINTRSPVSLFALIIAVGLALGSDAIATSTAILLVVFVVLETAVFRSPAVSEALSDARRNRALLLSAILIFLAALELGVTRFGTDIDTFKLWKVDLPELSLPGFRLWTDMFDLPRDGLPWLFHPGILISYEAPALVLGTVGYFWVLTRWVTGGPDGTGASLFQRFLVVWASGAGVIIAALTRREAGQLVLLLLPLALLGGCWLEALISESDLASLPRLLLFFVPVAAAIAYAVLVLANWVSTDPSNVGGKIGPADEPATLVLVTGGAVALLWLAWSSLGRRAIAGYVLLGSMVSLAFLAHGATSVSYGRGSEFLAGERLDRQVPRLETQLAAMGGVEGSVAADLSLLRPLGWYLRDVPGLVFVATPPADANALLAVPNEPVPAGYRIDRRWPIAQGWVPSSVDGLDWWKWLVYRKPYGNSTSAEADLLVKGP